MGLEALAADGFAACVSSSFNRLAARPSVLVLVVCTGSSALLFDSRPPKGHA